MAAIAGEIEDGDVLLEGIGTFLPTSAYLLAQAMHAPRSVRLCPVGGIFVGESHGLSLAAYEFETLGRGLARFDYWDVNGSYLPTFIPGRRNPWKEFLRPAQVDRTGRTNNVVIGPYDRPVVRLPGAAGLPDGVPVEPAVYMYVPRHDRNVFVERLDFVSTPGVQEGAKPCMVVTNLAVMRWAGDGVLEVRSLMPGVTPEQVRDQTGFDVRLPDRLQPFTPLSPEALRRLREDIDPLSLRDLELLAGESRLAHIEQLAMREPAQALLRQRLRALSSLVQGNVAT